MGFPGILKAILKYFFLTLFSVILIVNLFALILLYSAQGVLLNPDVYKAELEKTDAYTRAYAFIDDAIGQSPMAAFASGVKAEDIAPRPWLKAQANGLIDHAFAYVKGQELYLNLTISTVEPKRNALKLLESKAGSLPGVGAGLPSNLSGSFLPMVKAKIDEQVPDSLDLAQKLGGGNPLEPVRQGVSVFYTILTVLAVVAIVFFILIALMAHKITSIMRWVGFPLVASGSLCLVAVSVAKSQVTALLAGLEGAPGQFVMPIAADLFLALESSVSLWAGIALVLGVLLIAGSFFLKTGELRQKQVETAQKKKPGKTEGTQEGAHGAKPKRKTEEEEGVEEEKPTGRPGKRKA